MHKKRSKTMLKNIQKYIKHVLNYTVCAVIKFYAHQIIIHSGETTFNSWFLVLENKKFKPRLKDFVPVDHPKPQKHLSQVVASG
jgi:predicted PurR-regulated permease PerM